MFRLSRKSNAVSAGVAVAVIVAAPLAWRFWRARSDAIDERQIAIARHALRRDDFQRAEDLAKRVARGSRWWSAAQLIAGEAASRTGREEAALQYYAAVPRDNSPDDVLAALSRAEIDREIGRLADAVREYKYVLDHDPLHPLAHERIAFLLGATGQRWQARPHLVSILRSGVATWEQLAILGDLERPQDADEYLRECAVQTPGDPLVKLGLATIAVSEGRVADAKPMLQQIVERAPDLIAAQVMLGELLAGADDASFFDWHSRLPAAAREDPQIWFVRGLAARHRGNLRIAARCFGETHRLAPEHRRACFQLAQVLVSLAEPEADEFSERAARLHDLTMALDDVVRSKGQSEPPIRRVAELMEATGRPLEACAWAVIATRAFPSATWPEGLFARLAPLLNVATPQTIVSANLGLKHDLSRFPGFTELIAVKSRGNSPSRSAERQCAIRFEETRLDFVYFNGHDPARKAGRQFEQTGGGVAVLDYDVDGWPDLFFSQGTDWPPGAVKPEPTGRFTDCLYHNAQGGALVDVTRQSSLVDGGFGQGCTAGDFDNDGFPDLYVANIGRNQLQRNNGDGTFSDLSETCGIVGDDWTASCVLVDLNADGSPDLFDVTYLTGPRIYEVACNGHVCSPKIFEGIPDRLRLSRGDGTFELMPGATPESNSKGLGVIAFDLYERGRPCLFVANDQVPGYLLRNFSSADASRVRLEDVAFISGLALNADGVALAGMGIAADDVNGDGRIDFYVTTFKGEPKILFLQEATGFFVDATNAAGLQAPGLPFVGWGTQFLDADRDGAPDLVAVNGHVDDYRDEGGGYEMRPQCFWNTGGGRFVELARQAGDYFGREYLGRGMARIDFNRDGRMDFVVSNIGAPASLVVNRTADPGHFLNVRLHATATARDAIGSVVEVATAGGRWTKQLVAGDGYMASNERMLQFGLGEIAHVTDVTVHWPSGFTTTLHDLDADATLELIEGDRPGILWRGDLHEPIAAASQAVARNER